MMITKEATLPYLRSQAERLAWARSRFYKSPRAAANDLGWNENTYKSHENGIRRPDGLPLDEARKYARTFQVPLDWLVLGSTKGHTDIPVPIVGKAAAGPQGFYLSAYADGAHPILDPYPEGSIAVTVEGDSMYPRFNDGETLIFGPAKRDPLGLNGHEVLAYLYDERTLIKILKHNKYTGNWDLISHNKNVADIEDIKLQWVRPFIGLQI